MFLRKCRQELGESVAHSDQIQCPAICDEELRTGRVIEAPTTTNG